MTVHAGTGAPSTTKAVSRAVGVPGVMLAQNYTPGRDVTGYWMSEKLDGVCAVHVRLFRCSLMI